MSLITSYFGRPKGAKATTAASGSQNDEDDFEAPKKRGLKRERETEKPVKKESVREPPTKKAKKKAIPQPEEEEDEEELPWPEIAKEEFDHQGKPPRGKGSTATSTARPTLRAKRRLTTQETTAVDEGEKKPSKGKRQEKIRSNEESEEREEEEDAIEEIEDIPWDQPTVATTPPKKTTTTTTTKKGAAVKEKAPDESPSKGETKKSASTTTSSTPKATKNSAKKLSLDITKSPAKKPPAVVEAKPAPAKRGGGGGGYPFWMQNRAGPPNLGGKELPEGKPWCLWGKVFMCTGVLDSIERDDAFKLIEHYGGKVAKSITKNLTHAVVGTDAGAKKAEQIEARKDVTSLNEDGLFELIRNSPEQKPSAKDIEKFNKQRKTQGVPTQPKAAQATAAPLLLAPASPSAAGEEAKKQLELWVEKYKPASTQEIIANPEAVKKLREWLQRWERAAVQRAKRGETPAPRGATHKNAALLSGPPGIGKTTTAHLVAAECGYYPLEFNASDTRSKKMIKEHLAQSTENRGLAEYFTMGRGREDGKTVLIMDEVDGMSSGDRGGMAEIIALIKKTHIPVICLCNDRASAKVRSLANYCLDIQLRKPTTQQIQHRITQILQREHVALDNTTLTRIIDASNGDVRQLLNMLQMLTVKSKDLGALSPSELQERLHTSLKEVELGPFDAAIKLFNSVEYQKLSLDQKLDLYFVDPSFVPLFVQENYLNCRPRGARNVSRNPEVERLVEMDLISKAADSFSEGDLFDVAIHRDQDWSLQPIHGVFSTVRPAEFMTGNLAGRLDFPKWLGKFSSRKKRYRLLTELAVHMSGTTSGDKALLRLDYLPHLVRPLTAPLASWGTAGIDQVLALMDAYGITREDYDTILELMELSDNDWAKQIPTSVKTAFTRKYKAAHLAVKTTTKGRRGTVNFVLPEEAAAADGNSDDDLDSASGVGNDGDEGTEDQQEEEDDDMIVAKKSGTSKRTTSKKAGATRGGSSAGRGGGRGGRGGKAKS